MIENKFKEHIQEQTNEKSQQNKDSYGKFMRKVKRLHCNDNLGKEVKPSKQLEEYINYLKNNGLVTNKVGIGEFKTKNGLVYQGLIATQTIFRNENIIKIPMKQLLTTRDAYLSEIKLIFQENPEYFSNKFVSEWEDHIFIAFLLYEHLKGPDSRFYHIILNLPKDQEYVIFWDDQNLNLLEDNDFVKQIKKLRQSFELEYIALSQILQKYPKFFPTPDSYSRDNFKWAYAHLITRCFGKYLNYVTMAPFAELLNHECTDVYYDFLYNENNPNKSKESDYSDDHAVLTAEELEQMTSSEGSVVSEDPESDSETQYQANDIEYFMKDQVIKEQTFCKNPRIYVHTAAQDDLDNYYIYKKPAIDQSQNSNDSSPERQKHKAKTTIISNEKQQQQNTGGYFVQVVDEIKRQIIDVHNWLYDHLDYADTCSVLYMAQIYAKLELIYSQLSQYKNMTFNEAKQEIKLIETSNKQYQNDLFAFYKDNFAKIYSTRRFAQKLKRIDPKPSCLLQQQMIENDKNQNIKQTKELNDLNNSSETCKKPSPPYFKPDDQWLEDKFDHFVMRTSNKDQFEQGAQVFFCYGRLSNRMLLSRYGFAADYNKYDHVHLKIDFFNLIKLNKLLSPTILLHYAQLGLSRLKRFKLKWVDFNIEFVVFVKMAFFWDYLKHDVRAIYHVIDLDLEIKALQKCSQILASFLQSQKTTVSHNENLQNDKKLNYHQYFAMTYRLNRQRIVHLHLNLCNVCIAIFQRMLTKRLTLEFASLRVMDLESKEQYRQNRYLLHYYLQTVVDGVQGAIDKGKVKQAIQ